MQINVEVIDGIQVVELDGKLDSSSSPNVQEEIIGLVEENTRILLDMEQVSYMSSAGLRMLLLLNRKITEQSGRIILVGVSQRLQDVMSMTGFLRFFTFYDSVEAGLAAIKD